MVRESGESSIFWRILYAKILIFIVIFLLFSSILLLNVYLAFHFTKGKRVRPIEDLNLPAERVLKTLAFFAIMVISILGASTATSWWEEILRYVNASDFNIKDPIFQLDIGFYFFQLPFYKALRGWSWTAFLLSVIFSLAIYFIKGTLQFIKDWSNPFLKNVKTTSAPCSCFWLFSLPWVFGLSVTNFFSQIRASFLERAILTYMPGFLQIRS